MGDEFTLPAVLLALVLGVAASLIATWLWARMSPRFPTLLKDSSASLSGWWVGQLSPEYAAGRQVLNLIRLREHRGKVTAYIEHHNNRADKATQWRGIGIFASSALSLIYYIARDGREESGVWVLRHRTDEGYAAVLEGIYAHVVDRLSVGEVKVQSEPYTLRKIKVPFWIQLRPLFGMTCYRSFSEAASELNLKDTTTASPGNAGKPSPQSVEADP